jgi:hypothetical protein
MRNIFRVVKPNAKVFSYFFLHGRTVEPYAHANGLCPWHTLVFGEWHGSEFTLLLPSPPTGNAS